MSDGKYTMDFGWQLLLKDLGISASDALKQARLPEDLISKDRCQITATQYYALWEAMVTLSDQTAMPLRVATSISPEMFNPPLFAALCSPNMNTALERLAKYKPLVCPMSLTIKRTREHTKVELNTKQDSTPLPDTLIAMELSLLVHLARMATREHIIPLNVETSVALRDREAYDNFFQRRVSSSSISAITFSHKDANRPFLTVNDALWATFEPDLRTRLKDLQHNASITDKVRASLTEVLASGSFSREDVAHRLAMSPRTMQRRLKEENTSFQKELTHLREKLARHYLTTSKYSSAEISFLLGYDDPNSFYRAFHNWTGKTPDTVRQENNTPAHIQALESSRVITH